MGAVTYSFSADGTKVAVEDNSGNGYQYMGSLIIQTMNINIIKPSQLKNQLNIDPNVNKVEDSYSFLINLINNLNTANQ